LYAGVPGLQGTDKGDTISMKNERKGGREKKDKMRIAKAATRTPRVLAQLGRLGVALKTSISTNL
jgi:hypothetical protein